MDDPASVNAPDGLDAASMIAPMGATTLTMPKTNTKKTMKMSGPSMSPDHALDLPLPLG